MLTLKHIVQSSLLVVVEVREVTATTKEREKDGLSYEVVKGPEVVFFLENDVFKHAPSCCVMAF